jgi:hypothetical protein
MESIEAALTSYRPSIMVHIVTTLAEYKQKIANKEQLVVVDFFATWVRCIDGD